MSEMLERVARVIGENYDGYADPVATPNNWGRAMEATGDAIKAMREPTEAMLNAARDWSQKKYGKPIGNDAAIGCWQAMIDAALKE